MTTILLIEDAVDLANAIRRELESNGYRVRHAADGVTGLLLFKNKAPDLVILDWMLPKLSGLDVLREMRSQSAVPILMLTARHEEADRVIGLELGADDYLTKPFGMRELTARVRALLRRLAHVEQILAQDRDRQATPISYGPINLIPGTYQASLNDQTIHLTRTEFDLLYLLMRNPGRAFSRAYLLDTVWGEDYVTGDRSVDNTILRLRKKLGSTGQAIETVWGVDYFTVSDGFDS
jgi:DNA-binding response OmpR family regulator